MTGWCRSDVGVPDCERKPHEDLSPEVTELCYVQTPEGRVGSAMDRQGIGHDSADETGGADARLTGEVPDAEGPLRVELR